MSNSRINLRLFLNFIDHSAIFRSDEESNSAHSSSGVINNISVIKEHTENSPSKLCPGSRISGDVKTNPTAWSPIRSVGSMVGMEVHPESDGSVFDPDTSSESGVFGYDDDTGEMFWSECDVAWCMVSAGACTVDPVSPPNW